MYGRKILVSQYGHFYFLGGIWSKCHKFLKACSNSTKGDYSKEQNKNHQNW
jgi:hypothetical protein